MKILNIKKYNNNYFKRILKIIIFFVFIFFNLYSHYNHKKKIGVIGLAHSNNIGNNLLKYAIFIKLSQLGFDPYIIGMKFKGNDISLLKQYTKVKIINNNFTEIKENEYDILLVNSDQTWRKWNNYFYDIAFLKFSQNWNIPKIVYGASLGVDNWRFTKEDENIAKFLLKNFTGISVREIGSIKFIKQHLGINTIFVLDPTFLIDKKYYLNLIKDFKNDVIIDKTIIFVYSVTNSNILKNYLKTIGKKNKIYFINTKVKNQIKKFIYGIYNCKAVITDSFHGTVFSIIFNKPFISFVYKTRGNERFNTLIELFNINNRIFAYNSIPNLELLETPLNISKNHLKKLKKNSINFLKRNLYKYKYY